MSDLEDDDNDGKLEYYNFDDNTMYTMFLKSSSEAPIKIDKVNTSVSVSLYRVTE